MVAARFLAVTVLALNSPVLCAQATNPELPKDREAAVDFAPQVESTRTAPSIRPANEIAKPGANPVTRSIDRGEIRPAERAPVVDHRIKSRGIALPNCFSESREGETCK